MITAGLALLVAADLSVVSATRERVELRWNSASAEEDAVVWRRTLDGTYERIGQGRGHFVDRKFDPLGRYVYRVERQEAGPTNEVAAGAPPVALVEVWPAAKAAEVRLALDGDGDPHMVWLERQGPGATLWYGRWDRNGSGWSRPRKLVHVGQVERAPRYPVSIAVDRDTGAVGIAFEENRDGTRLMLAVAGAGGDFTYREILNGGGRWFADVRLAMARGQVHLAYQQQDSGVHYTHGALARDPRFWLTEAAPLLNGYRDAGNALDLALDGAGRPSLVYVLRNGSDNLAVLWQPPDNPMTAGHPGTTARSSVRLAFNGQRPFVVSDTDFQSERGSDLWLVSANERKEWGDAARIPTGSHVTLNAPLSIDVSGQSEVVLAAEAPEGQIHVARSGEAGEWPRRLMRKFEGHSPEIALAENGALLVAFATEGGIWFWREK